MLGDGLQAGLAGNFGLEPGRLPLFAFTMATANAAGREVLVVVAVVVVVDVGGPVDFHGWRSRATGRMSPRPRAFR
ncbi:hypothetical protein D3C79_754960 [compost metagenome]